MIILKALRGPLAPMALLAMLLALVVTGVFAENIVAPNQYAYSEREGWINFKPGVGPGVTVTSADLTGYAWGERIGWISLSCHNDEPGTPCASVGNWEVKNDGAGNLSGYAWSERKGWISFSCKNTNPTCTGPDGNWGVTISPTTGVFSGQAWGENMGWITFSCPGSAGCGSVSFEVQTSCTLATDPDCDGDTDWSNPGAGMACVQDHPPDPNGNGYSESDELTPHGAQTCTGAFPGNGGLGHTGLNLSCPGRPSGSAAANIAGADISVDGHVNSADLTLFAQAYNKGSVANQYDPTAESDLNHNGLVNSADLTLFANAYAVGVVPPC